MVLILQSYLNVPLLLDMYVLVCMLAQIFV